jgi:alanine racemase
MSTAPDEVLSGMRPTWAEIDVSAFARNVDAIASRLPKDSRLIAVMKADAYGHGAVELARCCNPERVAMIAVALLEEALELRRAGIAIPLLLLGSLPSAQMVSALDNAITVGVPGPEELEAICDVAKERDVEVHLKLDSGMGRMGVVESELSRVIEMIRATPRLRIGALYTHFANANHPADPFTERQLANFHRMVQTLREAGIDPPLHHTSNSAATMRGIIEPGHFVRAGISLYGGESLDTETTPFEPVMRWRSAIVRLKTLPAGHAIGYGTTFHTKRPSRIATLPVGYGDGYARLLSNRAEVLVRGRRAPVVGTISMDLVTVDVTDISDVEVGDEVILLGRQGNERITAEELAAKIGTISYEVFCNVSARVPRVYVNRQGNPGAIHSRFTTA